ncbi:MAG TPA: hypothetical protein VFE28_03545 [Candidatus Krumholzibacteria bacterium]|nr:hypothetical protein [Candidatus Krumholzibacteria bacterium]
MWRARVAAVLLAGTLAGGGAAADTSAVAATDTSATTVADSSGAAATDTKGGAGTGSREPLGWTELLREEEALLFPPQKARALLSHSFLQFGSEVVQAGDSVLVRNRDYGIDYARGVVYLLAAPSESLRVGITYLHLPGPRTRQFQAVEIVSREEALGGVDPAGAAAPPPPTTVPRQVGLPPGLQLSGSKTIGVSFGRNREASLEQSLRVQVSGSLGDDLRIDAVLADDNLPVVPEGNTEELGDLDRVFIEMQGPVIGGVVGDFDLRRTTSLFSSFERQLRGAEVRAHWHGQEASLGGGLTRGELQTATFRGTEGKQGPYELLSARRLSGSTILPGSERIYLDGQLLRRGENQDYVVDYVRGELRFTSRRRITADSEIAVDYQVSTERFQRQTRTSRLALQRERWKLQGMFVQEADDESEPVGEPLTPEEVEILRTAGDQPAVAPGIKVVTPGTGLYRYDSLDSTLVVYDPEQGNLVVDFYEIGTGKGSYDDRLDGRTGLRYFEHVGAGLGDFEIGRLLQPPNRTRLASAMLEGKPWKNGRFAGEASFSDFDGNLFASAGDGDNLAEALDLQFAPVDIQSGRGRVAWDMHYSQLSPRFTSLGRARPGFYYKDWNAEQDSLRSTERLGETTLRYEQGGQAPWLRLALNAGRLDRGEDLETRRGQVDFALGREQRQVALRWQRLDSEQPALGPDAGRNRHFASGVARYRLGPFLPEVRVEADEFIRALADSQLRPSYRYLDSHAALGVGGERLHAGIEFGRRDTESHHPEDGSDPWQADRRNDTYGASLLGRPGKAWNTEIAWSRRTFEPAGASTSSGSETDLARLQLRFDPPGRGLRGELRYEVTDDETRKLEQVLVLSPDGKGDYDAEGRAVGKDQGEYDKVYRTLGETESTTQLATSLRFEVGRGGSAVDSSASWWRRRLAFVQVLSVQEQTRDAQSGLYWLQPSAFQNAATLFGSFRARQEWSFLENSPENSLRLFLDWEDDLDGRFADQRLDSHRSRATLRFEKSATRRWSWSAEADVGRRERSGELDAVVPGRPSASDFDIRSQRLQGALAFRPTPSERLALEGGATRQEDRLSLVRQQLLALTPAVVLAPLRNLRLLGSVTATRVLEDKPPGALPPFLFDAPGTKTSATLTGSYRLARILNLNLTGTAVRNTDGRSTYDVKMETRAIF